MTPPTGAELVAWRADDEARTEAIWREIRNEQRATRRRDLYRTDPIWRLTKNKDNRERRLRKKRASAAVSDPGGGAQRNEGERRA